jgi:EAL domain-containing protein (putative c-di-GMP-specific phosphodiesterase class I)
VHRDLVAAAAADERRRISLMTRLVDHVTPRLEEIVDEFYDRLGRRPGLAQVIGRLSPEELRHVKERQAAHLAQLLSPRVGDRVLHERSREIGRVHALVGVAIEWYVDAVADHRRRLLDLAAGLFDDEEGAVVHGLLNDRFMEDLQGALLGYRDLDNAQHRVMLSVTRAVSDARTVADLARGVLEALSCLEGISVGFFARPDEHGRLQFEIGAGVGLDAFVEGVRGAGMPPISTTHGDDAGQGPAGRAWRTGLVQRCDSYLTDPSTAPWRATGRRFGWRSSVAVPLADRRGRTRALLSLYAHWPGFFASEACATMLEQIKASLEVALAELEERPALASAVSGFADRAGHLKRLADGAVEMLYQPVISLPDGRLTKLEALARLRGENRLIGPAEFLPAFGDDELFALFEQGMHQALQALRTWQSRGLTTGVSVNLPVVSAEDDRYSRLVGEMLQHYGVAGRRLTLELLETGFVDRGTSAQKRSLDCFKSLGVRLAQDDLGSGYSSLLRLRHFAFDDVKIDQSLVRGTELSPGAALHFIQPINDIAHSLGLSVVIEGLEDVGLIEVGVQLGVDEGQGYGVARPMPLDDVVDWAAGYHLDVDPRTPRSAVGALASHVAWEHRVNSLGHHQFRGSVLDLETCALTAYLRREGIDEAVEAHQGVHGEAVVDRGSRGHREAWEALATLVYDH